MTEKEEKEASPCFQFYPKDYFASGRVRGMTNQQKGIYVTLLGTQWLDGSIPAAIPELALLAGEPEKVMERLWPAIGRCFVPHPSLPGQLINLRLEKEREKQKANKKKRSESGKAGADARWSDSKEDGKPMRLPSQSTGERIPAPLAKDGFAVCSLQFADCIEESPKAGSLPGAPKERVDVADEEIEDAEHRLVAECSPEMLACGPDRVRRAVFQAMAHQRTLRPDGDPPNAAGVDSRTVAETCAGIRAWRASGRWGSQKGKTSHAPFLDNYLGEKRHLAPLPDTPQLAPGTTNEHLQRAAEFDKEAGL